MSEEEKNVAGEAMETTETQEPTNPYLSKEETTAVPVLEEQKKKSPLKIVIPLVIAAAVILIAALTVIFMGIFGNKKRLLAEAMTSTFKESGEYLAAEWKLEQYKGMFKDETVTVDMELELPEGIGMNMTVQQDGKTIGLYGEGSLSGMTLVELEAYLDETDMMFSLPGMLDYVFTIDRETLEDDIWNLVDMGMLDEETAEEIIALNAGEAKRNTVSEETAEAILKEIAEAWKLFYDKCEVEKLDAKEVSVNNKSVKAKGYVVTVSQGDLAELCDQVIAAYENSEEMSAVLETTLMSQGYGAYGMDEIYDEMYAGIDELREKAENILSVEFYLYDGKVAQIYAENEGTAFEWDIEGGNFPLENTSVFLGDDVNYFEISRTGSVEDGEYCALYDIDDSNSVVTLDLRYVPKNGEISFEILEDEYSLLYFAGSLEKKDDTTVSFSIDSLEIEEEQIMSGDITISEECGEIVKPEGEERNVLQMSEADWEEIIWELAMALY